MTLVYDKKPTSYLFFKYNDHNLLQYFVIKTPASIGKSNVSEISVTVITK